MCIYDEPVQMDKDGFNSLTYVFREFAVEWLWNIFSSIFCFVALSDCVLDDGLFVRVGQPDDDFQGREQYLDRRHQHCSCQWLLHFRLQSGARQLDFYSLKIFEKLEDISFSYLLIVMLAIF